MRLKHFHSEKEGYFTELQPSKNFKLLSKEVTSRLGSRDKEILVALGVGKQFGAVAVSHITRRTWEKRITRGLVG